MKLNDTLLVCCCGIGMFIGVAAGISQAAEPPLGDPNQPYDRFSMEVVTPHVKWANPSVSGPINALVIAPCWQFRDTVELAQRLSLNVTPLMVALNTAYYGAGESMSDLDGDLDDLAQLRLSDARQYQVIVIGKVVWSVLPATVREAILKKVAQGTGLVYVSPAGEDDALKAAFTNRQTADETVLLEGVPVAVMPLTLKPVSVYMPGAGPFETRLSMLGQGRVAVVDYHDLGTNTSIWIPQHWAMPFQRVDGPWHDYYFAIVARAMEWAARRELPVKVVPIMAQGEEVDRTALGSGAMGFKTVTTPDFQGPAKMKWRLRNEKDQPVFEKEDEVKLAGAQNWPVSLPALAGGLYLLDVWVEADGKTAGWGSSAFRVKSGGILKEIRMGKDVYAPGEAIQGEVVLSTALPEGTKLQVAVRDRLNRLVALVAAKANGTSAPFTFNLVEPLGYIFDVTARVSDKNGPMEEKESMFFIPNFRLNNFMFFQWGAPSSDPQSVFATRQMKRVVGLTGYYDSVLYDSSWKAVRPVALANARQGLQPLPYCTTHIIPPNQFDNTPDGLALKSNIPWKCMTVPASLKRMRDQCQAFAKAYAGCEVVAYSINEEGGVPPGESCFCDSCKKGFIEYAKKKYGTVDAANKVWGAAYKEWDEVRGGTLPDALKTGRAERWLDQRLYMLEAYNRWQFACIEGFHSVNKNALVGPHVVVDVDRSFDIPAMIQYWGTFGHDVDYMDAVRRSFMRPGDVSENESGNLPMQEDYHRYWPWHTLLQGMTQIFWYPEYKTHGLGGIAALYPDFRPFACYRQTGEEVREIQQGVGPLMIQGEMMLSPVAIHWSTLSYFMDIVHHPETRWLNSLRDAFHALADSGFVYRYLGTPQIESGALKDVKALVLPYSQVLTAREADAIRAFVKEGGLLFADFAPGRFDANGTRLATSSLADVFGDSKEMELKTFGKGHALLMGATLKGYTGRRGKGDAGDRRGMLRMIETYAGVKPWCRVEDKKGLDRGDTEITLFRNGDTYLLGLLRDPGIRAEIAGAGGEWTVKRTGGAGSGVESAETVVRLPKAFHIYDVRRHDYLGQADQFQTGLVKAAAKVFAFLPCKLTGLDLALSSNKLKQGDLLKMTCSIKPPEAKACGLGIRLTVNGPDGSELEDYARTLVMKNGRLETTLALALDELPGSYEVTATEVISGLQSKATYMVRAK